LAFAEGLRVVVDKSARRVLSNQIACVVVSGECVTDFLICTVTVSYLDVERAVGRTDEVGAWLKNQVELAPVGGKFELFAFTEVGVEVAENVSVVSTFSIGVFLMREMELTGREKLVAAQ